MDPGSGSFSGGDFQSVIDSESVGEPSFSLPAPNSPPVNSDSLVFVMGKSPKLSFPSASFEVVQPCQLDVLKSCHENGIIVSKQTVHYTVL